MKLAIVDYGSGNLCSAAKAFERASSEAGISVNVNVTADPDQVAAADRIILPGVGAFADCKNGLNAIDGMTEALHQVVIVNARPFLGICVGMQLMATCGKEHDVTDGLDWIGGEVIALKPNNSSLKIPHMGWNTLDARCDHPLLNDIEIGPDGLHAYFVHSYQFKTDNPEHVLAEAEYGGTVTALIGRDNLAGTQFHPEKSQSLGLQFITNFLTWTP